MLRLFLILIGFSYWFRVCERLGRRARTGFRERFDNFLKDLTTFKKLSNLTIRHN